MPHVYETDGAAIYRQSFATIRAEADLARFTPDEEQVVVRMIHACGMTDLPKAVRYAEKHGFAGLELEPGTEPFVPNPAALLPRGAQL